MYKYFEVNNSINNKLLIDDTYTNLCLSRKIAASSLPVVYVSESYGYVIRGGGYFREITLNGDESYIAVGGYTDRRCPYFIWHCLKQSGSGYEIKHFLTAASVINGSNERMNVSILAGSDRDNENTNLPSDYVPNDLYIYTFSKNNNSNQENLGFQVFNENNEIIFDSTNKYLNVFRSNYDVSAYKALPTDRALAVIDAEPYIYYETYFGGCYIAGHVVFESGWQDYRGNVYTDCHVGFAIRNTLYETGSGGKVIIGDGNSPHYVVIDVTGF